MVFQWKLGKGELEVEKNYFELLNNINVNAKIEKKNGLSYLSWAWAWAEVKKMFPDAIYTIYENSDGWNYHTDGKTAWVKTGVTINGIEHIEYLPVMDYRNKSILLDSITSFDVNKAIQRSLTKAVARHGLGLYIYAGEDLPEEEKESAKVKKSAQVTEQNVNEMISEEKYNTLQELISKYNSCNEAPLNEPKMLDYFKVSSFMTLTNAQYQVFVNQLMKGIK